MPTVHSAGVPYFDAPEDGVLDTAMCRAFERDGVLVLNGFADRDDLDALIQRAGDLVDRFDPAEVRSVFSSRTHAHSADSYFETSGDKIRFFLGSVDIYRAFMMAATRFKFAA